MTANSLGLPPTPAENEGGDPRAALDPRSALRDSLALARRLYEAIKSADPKSTSPALRKKAQRMLSHATIRVTQKLGVLDKAPPPAAPASAETHLAEFYNRMIEFAALPQPRWAGPEDPRLLVDAQAASGGAVDSNTAAMVRQIETAAALNKQLQSLAKDPVQDWVDSVGTWQEGARQVQADVLDSLSSEIASFVKTGKFSFESLAESIIDSFSKVIAAQATKQLATMFFGADSGSEGGGNGKSGGGGLFGNLLGAIFGGGGNAASGAATTTAAVHREGGYSGSPTTFASTPLAAFANAPHYAEGTANTSGIPAVLHENEAVIPLSRNRKVGVELGGDVGGNTVIHMPQTFNFPNSDPDSFRRSKKQVAADAFMVGKRAASQIR